MAQTETLTYLVRFKIDAADTAKLKQVETALKNFGATSIKTAETGVSSLTASLVKLSLRAAIVIPLWTMLRSVWISTFKTITDGAKSFIDLDTALVNARNEIQVSTNDLDSFMVTLRENAINLAKETGVAVDKVVESFRLFATAGIDSQTALAGMNTAVRGAVSVMGESEEMARFLADVYNQMGNKITEVSGAQEKFNYIMSTIATLMPTNTFLIKEFMAAYANFGGTAKAANLSLDQTFTLIAASATAMQRGARGGTQLASAFNQLSKNTQEIRSFLGRETLSDLSQFEIFFEVIKKAGTLINSPTTTTQGGILRQIEDIFGNRGGRNVKALSANLRQFTSELERMSKLSPDERFALWMERYGTATQKMSLQFSRMKEITNELVRSFIQGAVGGDTFAESLKKINQFLQDITPIIKELGEFFNDYYTALGKIVGKTVEFFDKMPSVGSIISTEDLSKGSYFDTFFDLAKAKAVETGKAIKEAFITGPDLTPIYPIEKLDTAEKAIQAFSKNYVDSNQPVLDTANKVIEAFNKIAEGAEKINDNSNRMKSWDEKALSYINPKNIVDFFRYRGEIDFAMDKIAEQERLRANLESNRQKILLGEQIYSSNDKQASEEEKVALLMETEVYTLEQKKKLTGELVTLGYNEVEIARMNYELAKDEVENGGDANLLLQAKVDLMIALNKEAKEFSLGLQKIGQTGLSDIFMNKGTFKQLGLNIGDAIRQGFADALSGNIMDQIFKTTNIGGIFGEAFANIRHANDKLGGPIKNAFDYGGAKTYDWILRGFQDGMSGQGGIATLTSTSGLSTGGLTTLPGFGAGGFFNRPIGTTKDMYGVRGGQIGPATQAQAASTATWGQAAGITGSSLLTGYSAYQAAGGNQGSLSMGSGLLSGAGSLLLGNAMLGTAGIGMGAGGIFASGGALAGLAGPIGLALMAGGMIMSMMSKTKSTSVQEQSTSKQVGSKIDVTNTKLDLVNRNLIALRDTMETYILPESAYFSEKRLLLEDQFSIDGRR